MAFRRRRFRRSRSKRFRFRKRFRRYIRTPRIRFVRPRVFTRPLRSNNTFINTTKNINSGFSAYRNARYAFNNLAPFLTAAGGYLANHVYRRYRPQKIVKLKLPPR